MPHAIWILLLAAGLALPMTAWAQSPPAPTAVGEAPPTALPDILFRAVVNLPVVLQRTDGSELAVRIRAVDPQVLIVSVLASREVLTLPRASVTSVRLLPAAVTAALAPEPETPSVPAAPLRPRHVGLNLSVVPGFDLDLDVGLFHGFANGGITLPLGTNGGIIPFSLGLGVGIPVRHSRGLKLDLFAHLNFVGDTLSSSSANFGLATRVAFGAGLGFHNTWDNGLTLGFTMPIIGYAIDIDQNTSSGSSAGPQGISYYFLTSVEALPLFFLGYRI